MTLEYKAHSFIEFPIYCSDFPLKAFFKHFNEPAGSKGLEVGANEEWCCAILQRLGYDMTGIDVRPFRPTSHTHMTNGKMTDYPQFVPEWKQIESAIDKVEETNLLEPPFDFAISLSAIEHFGLRYYEGDEENPDADSVAMDYIYKWLKPNGRAYITVPIGIKRQTVHWRQYNEEEIQRKIIRQFKPIHLIPYKWNDKDDAIMVHPQVAFQSDHATCELLLILEKVGV